MIICTYFTFGMVLKEAGTHPVNWLFSTSLQLLFLLLLANIALSLSLRETTNSCGDFLGRKEQLTNHATEDQTTH